MKKYLLFGALFSLAGFLISGCGNAPTLALNLALPESAYYKVQGNTSVVDEKTSNRISNVRKNILDLVDAGQMKPYSYNFCRAWAWYDFSVDLIERNAQADATTQALDETERWVKLNQTGGLSTRAPANDPILFSDFSVVRRDLWMNIEAQHPTNDFACGACIKAQAEVLTIKGGHHEIHQRFKQADQTFAEAQKLADQLIDKTSTCRMSKNRLTGASEKTEVVKAEIVKPVEKPVAIEKPAVVEPKVVSESKVTSEFFANFVSSGSKVTNILNISGFKDFVSSVEKKKSTQPNENLSIEISGSAASAVQQARLHSLQKYLEEKFPGVIVKRNQSSAPAANRCPASGSCHPAEHQIQLKY
jgi:hypothetical protein